MTGMHEGLREWSAWWTPGREDAPAMGELEFDSVEGPRVTLFELPPGLHTDKFRVPTLLGRTFEGTALTLVGAVITQWQTNLGAGAHVRIRLRADMLLRGGHRDEGEEVLVQQVRVRYAGLRELCFRTPPVNREPTMFLSTDPGAQRRIRVDGGLLTFECIESRNRSPFGEAWERDVEVRLDADEALPLAEFDERWLMPLQGLVILAGREPTVREALTLILEDPQAANYHPATVRGLSPEELRTQRVDVLTRTPGLNAEPSTDCEHLLVPFAALKDGIDDFVAAWFRLYAELGEAAVFLMSAFGSQLFLDNKLLNEMSFAESYHRVKHDEPAVPVDDHERYTAAMLALVEDNAHRDHYKQKLRYAAEQTARRRIKWLVRRAHELLPDVQGLNRQLADDLVDTRNALTHLDPTGPPAPLAGVRLALAVVRLEMVIRTNILLDLGLDPGLVAGLLANSYRGQVPVVDIPWD